MDFFIYIEHIFYINSYLSIYQIYTIYLYYIYLFTVHNLLGNEKSWRGHEGLGWKRLFSPRMQAASYLVVLLIIFFAPAYGSCLRTPVYNTLDRDLLPLIERLWYVKADAWHTDIHGNAPDNLVLVVGNEAFNCVREVKTFMLSFIRLHILVHCVLSMFHFRKLGISSWNRDPCF